MAAPAGATRGAPVPATTTTAAAANDKGYVSIIKVSGLLDPVLVNFITRSISDAEANHAIALVLQLNSHGAVVSNRQIQALALRMHNAKVPVVVWVGPSGASAFGVAAQLAGVANRLGIAPGSRLGKTGPLVVPRALMQPAFVAALDRLRNQTVGSVEAKQLGIAPKDAPVIGQLMIDIPGVKSHAVKGGREPISTPVFSQLPVTEQLLHTVSSPAAAYLLFVIGMALILFELFTAGVGVAGLVGAGFFVLACYGLEVLPARGWAVGLLVFSMFAYAIDVQTGVPRIWTGIATVSFVFGSLFLYDGVSMSWVPLLVGIAGMTLAMLAGMPAMVRTRFSTPTIGREWMVGEAGEAVADVNPDGVVRIREALWRARTNRATPITAGGKIRVVGIEGLLLEVEPEEGGARDHRERARKGSGE